MGHPVYKGLNNRMIGLLISFIVIGLSNGQPQCNLSPLFSRDYYRDVDKTEYPLPYKNWNDIPVFDTCAVGEKTHYTQELGEKEDGIFGTCFVQTGASCLGHMIIKYRNIRKIAKDKCEFSFADVTITHNCIDFFRHHMRHTRNATRVYDLTRLVRGSSFINHLTIAVRKSVMKINFNFTLDNNFFSNSRMNKKDMFEYMTAVYKAKLALSRSVEIYRITMEEEHFSRNPLIYIEGIPQLTPRTTYNGSELTINGAELTIYYGLVFPETQEYDCHFIMRQSTHSESVPVIKSLQTIVLGGRNGHESAVSEQFEILKAKFIHYKFNVTAILKEKEYLEVELLSANLLVSPKMPDVNEKKPDVNETVDVNPLVAAPFSKTTLEVRNNKTLKPFIQCIQQYQFIDLLKAMWIREPNPAYMIGERGKVYHHIDLYEDDPHVLSLPISNQTILILPLIYIDNDGCEKDLVNEDENENDISPTTTDYNQTSTVGTYTPSNTLMTDTEPSSMATEKSLDAVPKETQSALLYNTNTTEPTHVATGKLVDVVTDESQSSLFYDNNRTKNTLHQVRETSLWISQLCFMTPERCSNQRHMIQALMDLFKQLSQGSMSL